MARRRSRLAGRTGERPHRLPQDPPRTTQEPQDREDHSRSFSFPALGSADDRQVRRKLATEIQRLAQKVGRCASGKICARPLQTRHETQARKVLSGKAEPVVKPEENIAEFAENKIQEVKSLLQDVVIEKPVISIPVPQQDLSKEFKEICDAANSLAEEIDSANTFAKDQYTPPVASHKPENSFEGIQQNILNLSNI